jgi:hypothetical protein
MYHFIVKGKKMALQLASALSLRISNPAFDNDFIYRQFSSSLTLPEGGNGIITQLANHPNNAFFKEKATLFIAGFPFDTGQVKIKSRANRTFSLEFQNEEILAIKKLENIKINEVLEKKDFSSNFQGISFYPQPSSTPIGDYSITVFDTVFSEQYPNVPTQSHQVATNLAYEINLKFPDFARVDADRLVFDNWNKYPIFEVQNNGFSASMLPITWQTPPLYTAFAMDTWATDIIQNNTDSRVCFPLVHNSALYGGQNKAYSYYINHYLSGFVQGEITDNKDGALLTRKTSIIPMLRLSYILERIAIAAGLSSITVLDLPEFDELCLYSTHTFDALTEDFHDTPNSGINYKRWFSGYDMTLDFNKQAPDMLATDLILGLCKAFDLKAVAYDNAIVLQSKRRSYAQKPIDLTRYATRNYSIIEKEVNGYKVQYSKEDADKRDLTNAGLEGIKEGKEKLDFSLFFNTLYCDVTGNKSFKARVPISEQEGDSSPWVTKSSAKSMRLLLYKGLQPLLNDPTIFYPYAINEPVAPNGSPIGTLSLKIKGTNGIYETFLRQYLQLLQSTQTLKKTLNLPASLAFKIAQNQTCNAFFHHPEGDVSGVISELNLKVEQGRYGWIDAEVEVIL